jgi:hypothetical protein
MESAKINLDSGLDIFNTEISIIENYPSEDITLFLHNIINPGNRSSHYHYNIIRRI